MSKDTLVDRLRGKYAVGPGDPPEFGYRTFTNLPPIFGEAAFEIEHLRAALAQAEADRKVLVEECKAWRKVTSQGHDHRCDEDIGFKGCRYCNACKETEILKLRDATDAAGALTRGAAT